MPIDKYIIDNDITDKYIKEEEIYTHTNAKVDKDKKIVYYKGKISEFSHSSGHLDYFKIKEFVDRKIMNQMIHNINLNVIMMKYIKET